MGPAERRSATAYEAATGAAAAAAHKDEFALPDELSSRPPPPFFDAPLLGCLRSLGWYLISALQLSLLPPRLEGLLFCRWRLLLTPTWVWLLFEISLALYALRGEPSPSDLVESSSTTRGDEEEHTPLGRARRVWRQAMRSLWLGALVAGGLTLSWVAAALDAAEAGVAPALQVMAPLAFGLLTFVGCIACTCGATGSPRRAAANAWGREWSRWTTGGAGGGRRQQHGHGAAPAPAADELEGGSRTSSYSASSDAAAGLGGATSVLALTPEEGDPDPREVMRAAYEDHKIFTPLPGKMPEPEDDRNADFYDQQQPSVSFAEALEEVAPPPADAEAASGNVQSSWEQAFDDTLLLGEDER